MDLTNCSRSLDRPHPLLRRANAVERGRRKASRPILLAARRFNMRAKTNERDGMPDGVRTDAFTGDGRSVGRGPARARQRPSRHRRVGYGDFGAISIPGYVAPTKANTKLALGGVLGESSIWKQKYFNLTLASSGQSVRKTTNYVSKHSSVSEDDTNDVQIVPGQQAPNRRCLMLERSQSGVPLDLRHFIFSRTSAPS